MLLFNQFLVPSFITIFTVFSSFFPPHAQLSSRHNTVAVNEHKKTFTADTLPTVTPTRVYTKHTEDQENAHDSVQSPTSQPVITLTPTLSTISNGILTAKTTLTVSGKTIHLTMQYAKDGGAITGTMSGDCTGDISGTFSGVSSGNLSGSGNASCTVGFFKIPVTMNFNGHLTAGDTQVAIHYAITAAGQKESGDTTLSLQ